MKYIATLFLVIATLALGACANRDSASTQTYQSTSSTGLSK